VTEAFKYDTPSGKMSMATTFTHWESLMKFLRAETKNGSRFGLLFVGVRARSNTTSW
jgi:hypothetical protein